MSIDAHIHSTHPNHLHAYITRPSSVPCDVQLYQVAIQVYMGDPQAEVSAEAVCLGGIC